MTFEIKNPNYSGDALEEAAAAVISRQDSAGFDITAKSTGYGGSRAEGGYYDRLNEDTGNTRH